MVSKKRTPRKGPAIADLEPAKEPEERQLGKEVAQQADIPEPILQFFEFAHLPADLQSTSAAFRGLAHELVHTLPRNAERTTALRKLLEAKDAAIRARLAK